MTNEISISLRPDEWRAVLEALDLMLDQRVTPKHGANPFAIYDHIWDEMAEQVDGFIVPGGDRR
mgnify:CR=1 FL=1|jgi:hypothetical protein